MELEDVMGHTVASACADIRLDEASALHEARAMVAPRMRWFGLLALACIAGGNVGCSGSSCGKCTSPPPYSTRAVAPEEQTALGFSANQVKERFVGPWVGTLAWVADPAKVTAYPATGTTTMTVAVRYALDERSIQATEPTDVYTDASAALLGMDVPIHLLVATADGALSEDHLTALRTASLSQGTVRDSFGADNGTPVQGTYTATAVDTARYLGTPNELEIELSPDTATGRLILHGLGSAKSPDGRSDVKISDEFLVGTFAGTAITDTADGGAGPVD
jgi:hypothetical protein